MRTLRLSNILVLPCLWLATSCGTPDTGDSTQHIEPSDGPLVVSVGRAFACVADPGHGVYCWGDNTYGQLGEPPASAGGTAARSEPRLVSETDDAIDVTAGAWHACAVLTEGVRCWGLNDDGQLGVSSAAPGTCRHNVTDGGDAEAACQPTPTLLDDTELDFAAAGADVTCVAKADGAPVCHGPDRYRFGDVGALRNIAFSERAACGIDEDAGVHCAGDTMLTSYAPFQMLGDVLDIAISDENGCVVEADGETGCWGSGNSSGQLGAGHTNIVDPWVMTNPVASAVRVRAGDNHFCALQDDGRVQCWGRNESGQLGTAPDTPDSGGQEMVDPETDSRDPAFCPGGPCSADPLVVAGLPPVASLSAGGDTTCAVTADREVYCWGRLASSPQPVLITGPWD